MNLPSNNLEFSKLISGTLAQSYQYCDKLITFVLIHRPKDVMKILLVEDELEIAKTIQHLLQDQCYAVDIATDGLQGLAMAEAFIYDLMLLDIALPHLDGVSLCQKIRIQRIQTPILLLTGQEADIYAPAIALNAGADDYMTKPFEADELLARIQSLVRRGDLKAPVILRWGALCLDPRCLQVSYGEKPLNLTPKEYSILEILLRNVPKITSAEAILEHCWSATETPGNENVRSFIKLIRKKLKAAGAPTDFISTHHRQGYRLNPIYGDAPSALSFEVSTALEVAQLQSTNEQLRRTIEHLQRAQTALKRKNKELTLQQKSLAQEQSPLPTSEALLHPLNPSNPVGIIQTSTDGSCLNVNECWQKMSGLSLEKSLGNGWQEAIHPEDRIWVSKMFKTCWHHHKDRQTEFRLINTQGQTLWIKGQAATIKSVKEKIIHHIYILTDITQQKLSTIKSQQQAILLELSTDAMFVCDLKQRLRYWNPGAERLLGWRTDEALGQTTNKILACSQTKIESIIRTLFAQGQWHGEIDHRTKKGGQVTVSAHWMLVRDNAGNPQSIAAVETNITEKKQLESQFHQAQRLESLAILARSLKHDFNNIFTPISTITHILSHTQKNLDEQGIEYLKILEESTKKGSLFIKEIFNIVQPEEEEIKIINLLKLLNTSIIKIQKIFPESIKISFKISPQFKGRQESPSYILANPTQINQIILHLCMNARDAMPDDGTLSIYLTTVFVDEAMASKHREAHMGQYVVINITDTGTGISPRIQARMFDPFFSTKPLGHGTGLGLTAVRGLVKANQGFLQVFSTVGRGTQFKLYFPAVTTPDTHPNG